jgi:hypothetical protein
LDEVWGAATSSNVQVEIVEDVIPKLMDVEAEPPCGGVQADALALELPFTTAGDPHVRGFTEAVLIRSACDGEAIARQKNAITRNRRMAFLRSLFYTPGAARVQFFGLNDPNITED